LLEEVGMGRTRWDDGRGEEEPAGGGGGEESEDRLWWPRLLGDDGDEGLLVVGSPIGGETGGEDDNRWGEGR
jgi:hypothetical protein